MAAKLTNKQKQSKRKKQKNNKVKKMERQDELGISRKEVKGAMRPEVFIILKIISIIAVPLMYLLYSPFLIFAVIFSSLLLIFAFKTEKYMNKSYIKKNHIKIPKFDSIIACIVILITVFGTINSLNTKKKMPAFNIGMEIKIKLENTGSCLTGRRGIFNNLKISNFAPASLPDGFEGPKPQHMEMEDLPVEMLFSVVISSLNSVLLILIPISSGLSLWMFIKKRKRLDKFMNEIISDDYEVMSDDEIKRLLMFDLIPLEDTTNLDNEIKG